MNLSTSRMIEDIVAAKYVARVVPLASGRGERQWKR